MTQNTPAKSVSEFCQNNNISQSFFYKLLKQGKAPRIMKIGNRTIITAEAENEWRKAMEA